MRDEIAELASLLAPLGAEASLAAGARLWREGDAGDHVAFLLEGELEVVHEEPGAETVVLRRLEPGSVVGELAAIDGQCRSATVRAAAASRVLRIGAADFREALRQRPVLLEALYWLQVERVRSLTTLVTRSHHRAITDELTRLYNYRFFRERLAIEVERARATGEGLALVIFDVDHFKSYNDQCGHQAGNDALVRIAALLKEHARRGDVLARYGGEEFVALLYGAAADEAVAYAERAREAVGADVFPGGATQPLGRVTVSAGVATYPDDAKGEESLVAAADRRLYAAKGGGRDRVVASDGKGRPE